MPSINMIAPRRAEKERKERDMRRLMVVVAAELFIAVALGGWACTNLITTRKGIDGLDAQIAKLQPVVNQIKDYDTATNKLKPKLKLLNDAKSVTMRWYNTLDMLTQSLPESTYLTRVGTSAKSPSAKQDNSSCSVLICGVTTTQALVGETMLRVQEIPNISGVVLHYTRDTTLSEYDVPTVNGRLAHRQRRVLGTEFEISTQLKLSDSKGAKDDGNQS